MPTNADANADANAAVEVLSDLVYSNAGGRPRLLDLVLPPAAGPRPVVVWLHGGGWRYGDRRLAPDLARHFAARGYAMASIDYRLSKEAVFPAALQDVKTAVRWLRAQAPQYGLDTARIALWGSSAGGHLAALAATSGPGLFEGDEHLDHSSAVAAVVDLYGPSDFLQMDAHRDAEGKPSDDAESIQLPKGKRSADADSLESLFIGAPIETVPERVRAANPISYVRPGLPPFLLLHGSADTAVPSHQSGLLYEALSASGSDVTFGLVHGLGHGFSNRRHLDDVAHAIAWRDHKGERLESSRVFACIGDWLDARLK